MRKVFGVIGFLLISMSLFASAPSHPFRKEIDTTVNKLQYRALKQQFAEATTVFYDSVRLYDNSYYVDIIPVYKNEFHEKELASIQSEIPLDYNRYVQNLINVYAVDKRNIGRVVAGKMPYYEQIFEEILAEHEVPTFLKYLGIVESGINPYAVSRSGATGIWQFMYGTGKHLGLQISYFRDDRKDVYTSTHAAAEYLKYLHGRFGDWLLAIGAYNCGPGNMAKAIRRSGGKKNFWEVRKYLPKETRNYVPAFIAVCYMMEKRDVLNIMPLEPTNYHYPVNGRSIDQVMVNHKLSFSSISKVLDLPMAQLSFLNPGIKKNIIPYSKDGYALKLPCDKVPLFNALYDSIMKEEQNYASSLGDTYYYDRDRISYRVRSGDNLSTIATKHNCTVRELMEWNNLKNHRIYAKQLLVVYSGDAPKNFVTNTSNVKRTNVSQQHTKSADGFVYYTIERGDTLWSISKKFPGVAVDSIKQDNQIYNVHNLQPGMVLKIGVSSNG